MTTLERLQVEPFSQLAISKGVEQVGEMSHRVLRKFPSFAAQYSTIPLRESFQLRNRISHGYETLDWNVIWRVATRSVPEFRRQLEPILREAGEDVP
ncbi:DUF86 domain-containing protein [Fulvimarina pelagi]